MYFDNAEGPVFRPPSEADSLILRATIGCSHNACTYCNMYRSVAFRMRPQEEIDAQLLQAQRYGAHIHRVFLGDGNALVLPTERLLAILAQIQAVLPKVRRVSCYAGPKDMLRKTPAELIALRQAGLKLVYYGMESGDDAVLAHVNKGVTAAESIEAGQRITAAGIKLSMMVILGLGGQEASERHARNTALAVSAIRPHMLSALTLMMYRGSELLEEFESGSFPILSPAGIMGELHLLLQGIELPPEHHCLFRSNHISNYINFAGTLPKDKERLLSESLAAKDKLALLKNWDPYNNVER